MTTDKQFTRQIRFIAYYLDRGSRTYSNMMRAALKAGYSESYARKIGSQLKWESMEEAVLSVRDELIKLCQTRTGEINGNYRNLDVFKRKENG